MFPLDKLVTCSYALGQANKALADLSEGRILGRSIICF